MHQDDVWLYPHAVTAKLGGERGGSWQELTEYIATLEEDHEDSLAFSLMMVRLCGCVTCQPGCYKLSLGCETCALRTVANERSTDKQLLRRFHTAQKEVHSFLGQHKKTS